MADPLIRNVPDHVVAAVDERAQRAGLSRAEYLRRLLARDLPSSELEMSVTDFARFSETFADLEDPEIMRGAWT